MNKGKMEEFETDQFSLVCKLITPQTTSKCLKTMTLEASSEKKIVLY